MDKTLLVKVDLEIDGLPNDALCFPTDMCGYRFWFLVPVMDQNPYGKKTLVTSALHDLDLYLDRDYQLFNAIPGQGGDAGEFCIAVNDVEVRDAILKSEKLDFENYL